MGSCISPEQITILSDESKVREIDFDLEIAKQSYDPLGVIYRSLTESTLIKNLNVPPGITLLILSCLRYTESTIHCSAYDQMITSSPTKGFSECCLLINPPINSKLNYMINSLQYKCGFFDIIPKDKWPDDASIYFQIELFDGTNHIGANAVNRSKYNVLWTSDIMKCGKSRQVIRIKNINLKLEPNQTYLIWVECIKEKFHALYTKYDPNFQDKTNKQKYIYQQVKHALTREVKLCDNRWFLRNVSKIWQITFTATM